MKQQFYLQDDINIKDIQMLHPNLLVIFATILQFADSHNYIPLKLTSIISDRVNTKAKTRSHEDGRAIDFSVKNWKRKDIEALELLLELKHKNIAAISASTGKPRPLVCHEYKGQGMHCHAQVRP